MANQPDRLYISKDDQKLYDVILENEKMFSIKVGEVDRKDQFIFAMAYGFMMNTRSELKKRIGLVRLEYLSHEDESFINSVAMFEEKDANVLSDKKKVYSIAEEYASGGIKILASKIENTEFGSFEKAIEKDIILKYSTDEEKSSK